MVAVPLCKCRVLYIGSAVPTITKDGLQGIQQPLKERYPVDSTSDTRGIDSFLSVWSNGILLEYIEGDKPTEAAFYPINSLHYCAAVRYVNVTGYAIEGGGERFLPLDSPFAYDDESRHPPLFAAIFRRTTGIKVLECHAYICTNSKAANALVRCCFYAYAECMCLKLDERLPALKAIKEASRSESPPSEPAPSVTEESIAMPAEDGKTEEYKDPQRWAERSIKKETWERRQQSGEYDSASITSSMAKRFSVKKNDKIQVEQGAVVPYANGTDTFSRQAGSDGDAAYGDGMPGFANMPYYPLHHPFHHNGMPPAPHMLPPHPLMRPPPMMFSYPPQIPPHFMPPPHAAQMQMIPPHFGVPTPPPPPPPLSALPPGLCSPPPMGLMPPRFLNPFGPMPPPMGRPRTPTDGPIVTGPDSVYGTLTRRAAYEEPIYMPGNMPYMPPQASYQPSNYPSDQYDSYYDSFKRQRSPKFKKERASGGESQTSSRHVTNTENDDSSQFWETYEANVYRKPHLNEKAFSATARSMPTARNSTTVVTEADVVRPDTPPADYDSTTTALQNIHISKNGIQHNSNAVMY